MRKQENRQMGIMMAIAMVAVVGGHCYNWGGMPGIFMWLEPYSFHLPTFAFISGYFFQKISLKAYPKYIWGKVKKLIIPLYIYNALYGILTQVLKWRYIYFGEGIELRTLLYMPIVSQHQFMLACPGWYVIPIFAIYLIYPLWSRLIGEKKYAHALNLVALGVSAAVFVSVFDWNQTGGITISEDARVFLSRLLLLFPFFQFGVVFRSTLEPLLRRWNLAAILGMNLALRFVLLAVSETHMLAYSICWANDFQGLNGVICLLGSLNGILIVYAVAGLIADRTKTMVYQHLSLNTYDIMMNHLFGFFLCNCAFAMLSKVGLWEFDWGAFKTNVYYQITPFVQFNIVYIIGGLSVCFAIIMVKNRLKKRILTVMGDRRSCV